MEINRGMRMICCHCIEVCDWAGMQFVFLLSVDACVWVEGVCTRSRRVGYMCTG